MSRWGGEPMPGADPNLIRVTDQCTTGAGVAGQPCEHGIANLNYRATSWGSGWVLVANYRGSASYLVGGHTMKFGYQGSHLGDDRTNYLNDQFVTYRFNNGVANQVTQQINQYTILQRVRTTAFFAQDAWTLGRATIQGAVRYDHAWSYFPEQTIPSQRFFPTARTFEYTEGFLVRRHSAARWRRVRCVWHRQDVGQVQHRPLPRGGAERWLLHHQQPDRSSDHDQRPHLDRQRQRLRRRLQPVVTGRAGPCDDGEHRHLRRGQREFRHNGGCFDAQSGADLGLGRPHRGLAVGRGPAARSDAARLRGADVTSAAGCSTSPRPTTGTSARSTTPPSR